MVRGLAALAVCAGHLRALSLVSLGEVRSAAIFDKVFYFVTSLGYQSVIVFFVLSGFFVAGGVVDAWSKNRWSWGHYALRRLARLWTVLLPALALTFLFDMLGSWMTSGRGYDGSYHSVFPNLPSLGYPTRHSLSVLLGNAAFLQTVLVPAYGTNGPLWSLANEFWYYVLFPLSWVAILGSWRKRWIPILVGGLLLVWLPGTLLLGGIVWLFGLVAWQVCRSPGLKTAFAHPVWMGLAAAAFVVSLVASKRGGWLGSDYFVGATFALLVPGLAARNSAPVWYQHIATRLSNISYTLYVVHFPLLVFITFAFFAPVRHQPDFSGYALYSMLLAGVLVCAGGVWWIFERNTDRIRQGLQKRLFKQEPDVRDKQTVLAKRIAWVVHSPTPYKVPFFKMLAARPPVDVTFFFLYWDDPQRAWQQEDLPGLKYKVLPGTSFRKRPGESELVHFGPAVVGELRKGHFDLVVICGYSHPTLLFALFYCLITGTPFVLQGESHVVQQRHPLKQVLKRCLLFPLLRRAKAAFATGRKAADYWVEAGIPRERVFTLSNTPDIVFFLKESALGTVRREAVRKSLGLSSRRTGIFVGRFVEVKGVEIILEAMAGLPSEKQPQLLLVGDGPLKSSYEKIIQRHNLPVRLVGFQQKDQLPELYAAADFFILPSLIEPWGVVVNEAMACGLPLLLSDQVGAAYDLLEEGRNGFMIPAGDVAAWRKALVAIMELTDAELQHMGAASREIVRPWNHEANVRNVLECVNQIFSENRKQKAELKS